jgi:glycosyltransferase involved in cell wall biosynthesis
MKPVSWLQILFPVKCKLRESSELAKIMWHSCAPWAPSGYGTQTAIWTKELKRLGHEIIISSYWGIQGAATQWEGMTVLPGFGGNYCSPSLFQHAKHFAPDLVVTLGDIWVMDPNVVKALPVAHWLPGDCRPMSLADRTVAEQSGAQLVAMSQFGQERFKTAGFNSLYVPHGIDTTVFRPLDNVPELREACGLEPDQFVIGINQANNDAIRKALPEQMLAFAKFARNHPDAILTLHTGVHQDGGQDLEAVAENLGILDQVRVVDQYRYSAGMITPDDLNEWYNVIDVLGQTVYAEGFGLPIMEAQAAGTPVITTNASSMVEVNPLGQHVDGQPFWNGVHKGWWIAPDVTQIYEAYELAYEQRKDVVSRKLRDFAKMYDYTQVSMKYMQPVIAELLARMEVRRARTS